MSLKSKELRQRRAKIVHDMRELVETCAKEGREFDSDEHLSWERMEADETRLKAHIDRLEQVEEDEYSLAQPLERKISTDTNPSEEEKETRHELYREAWRGWIRGGFTSLTQDQRTMMQNRAVDLPSEVRALGVGTDTAGGFAVPDEDMRQIVAALARFGGVRASRSTVISTSSGADLPIPTSNDTANVATILAENTAAGEQDVSFAQTVLSSFMYTSGIIRVSFQMLQDSSFPLEPWLRDRFVERHGRGQNAHFTTGTGTGQPQGIVTGSTLGVTGAAGQLTTHTYNDIVDLEHSVDPAYRGSAEWMFHDTTLAGLKKIVDGDARPLWAAGIATGQPDTLMGYPYVINQDMAVPAASAISLLFGDMSAYLIRDVMSFTMLRLTERYAENLQVAFLGFMRTDGRLVDAGTNPIKHFQHAAT